MGTWMHPYYMHGVQLHQTLHRELFGRGPPGMAAVRDRWMAAAACNSTPAASCFGPLEPPLLLHHQWQPVSSRPAPVRTATQGSNVPSFQSREVRVLGTSIHEYYEYSYSYCQSGGCYYYYCMGYYCRGGASAPRLATGSCDVVSFFGAFPYCHCLLFSPLVPFFAFPLPLARTAGGLRGPYPTM